MPKPKHIMIIATFNRSYEREVFAGITRYAIENAHWELFLPFSVYRALRCRPRSWRPDGIIQCVEGTWQQTVLQGTARIPSVGVATYHDDPARPHVSMDDAGIGKMAARYFLDKGFVNLAFFGEDGAWSVMRGESFRVEVRKAGGNCWGFLRTMPTEGRFLPMWHRAVAHWLLSLPKPVGIMACNDLWGSQVLSICTEIGIPSPESVAVVGVDNDELLVYMTIPSLSSVEPGFEQAGYEAAALLYKLMAGEKISNTRVVIPPVGVITRRSSDILALTDPHVSEVVRKIRDRATESISVEDLLTPDGISRRSLERRFRELLGRTVHDEVVRVRLAKAKRMLATTDQTILDVAMQCGFNSVETLYRTFRSLMGMTPADYRRQFRNISSR